MLKKFLFTLTFLLTFWHLEAQNFDKYYSFPVPNEIFNHTTLSTNNNIYAVGSVSDSGFYAVKFNSSGAVLKETIFQPNNANFKAKELFAAFKAPDDGFYTVGRVDSAFKQRIYIAHLDSTNQITFSSIMDSAITNVVDAKQFSTGEIVIVSNDTVGNGRLFIQIYSPTQKSIIQSKVYPNYEQVTALNISPADDVIVAGKAATGGVLVAKINKSLTSDTFVVKSGIPSFTHIAMDKNGGIYSIVSEGATIYKFDKNLQCYR